MRGVVAGVLLLLPLWAQAEDEWELLKRAGQAGRSLPLQATYTHQLGGEMETFQLFRASEDGVSRERHESVDGMPREIVRNGSDLACFAPEQRALNAARFSAIKLFPAVLPDNVAELSAAYVLSRGGMDRVAQTDCQWLLLKPRDANLRYTQRLCVEPESALPLRVVTSGARGEVIEQFSFTELALAAPRDRGVLKPRYKLSLPLGRLGATQTPAATPLEVKGLPIGFRLVRYAQRAMPGHDKAVQHYVYSDGFAKLSLFVEDHPEQAAPSAATVVANGIGMASRQLGGQMLTVVGDLPEAGLQSVLKSVRLVQK